MPGLDEGLRGSPPTVPSETIGARRWPLQLPLFDLLVLCCGCSRLRTENGRWSKYTVRAVDYPDTEFSHGICPACLKRLYPFLAKRLPAQSKAAV